jgi:hypothetical protein
LQPSPEKSEENLVKYKGQKKRTRKEKKGAKLKQGDKRMASEVSWSREVGVGGHKAKEVALSWQRW